LHISAGIPHSCILLKCI